MQSNGRAFCGEVLESAFASHIENVLMNILPDYEVLSLQTLERLMVNDKSENGSISVKDTFEASNAVSFGTAISTFSEIEMIDLTSFILTSVEQKVKVIVQVESDGGEVIITPERVPVEHLRSGKDAKRIGVDFTQPLKAGSITVTYTVLK